MADRTRIDVIREACLAKAGAVEDHPWDHVVFKVVGKIFAITDTESERVTVKTTPEKKPILEQDPAISSAPYLGSKGWVMLDLTQDGVLDIFPDLMEESYALIVQKLPKKAQKELSEWSR